MRSHTTYITCLAIALFATTCLIVACEEAEEPVLNTSQQFALAPMRIEALNVASGQLVEVAEVAVDNSPVLLQLDDIDAIVEIQDKAILYVSNPSGEADSVLYNVLVEDAVTYAETQTNDLIVPETQRYLVGEIEYCGERIGFDSRSITIMMGEVQLDGFCCCHIWITSSNFDQVLWGDDDPHVLREVIEGLDSYRVLAACIFGRGGHYVTFFD